MKIGVEAGILFCKKNQTLEKSSFEQSVSWSLWEMILALNFIEEIFFKFLTCKKTGMIYHNKSAEIITKLHNNAL